MNTLAPNQGKNQGKVIAGLIVIIVGIILLLRQSGYNFPTWLFTWPMILILIGLISGAKHRFRNIGWLIMVFIGGIFLADEIDPALQISHYGWPVLIICCGIWMIFAKGKMHSCKKKTKKTPFPFSNIPEPEEGRTETKEDTLNTFSVFGSATKRIFSKDFKGGEIVNVFGGSEIDLTRADIDGKVFIDITQLFGGTKIVLPPHWQVIMDVSAIFAGIDDKRNLHPNVTNSDKVLVLKGVSIFAGIEIRSY